MKKYIFQVKNYSRDLEKNKCWTNYQYLGKMEVIFLLFAIFCWQARSQSYSWDSSAASFQYLVSSSGLRSSGGRDSTSRVSKTSASHILRLVVAAADS